MFGVTGGGLAVVKTVSNGGKKHRHGIDTWDRQSTSNLKREELGLQEQDASGQY